MTGRRQHYGVESLHLLGYRMKRVELISATKDTYVDENYFAIFNSLFIHSICNKFYITPICVTLNDIFSNQSFLPHDSIARFILREMIT